jgi:hypothetical protein
LNDQDRASMPLHVPPRDGWHRRKRR